MIIRPLNCFALGFSITTKSFFKGKDSENLYLSRQKGHFDPTDFSTREFLLKGSSSLSGFSLFHIENQFLKGIFLLLNTNYKKNRDRLRTSEAFLRKDL